MTLHTSLGDIKMEIYCEEVPISAENFLALCASGYYDGTLFHRNIKGFMLQGGRCLSSSIIQMKQTMEGVWQRTLSPNMMNKFNCLLQVTQQEQAKVERASTTLQMAGLRMNIDLS